MIHIFYGADDFSSRDALNDLKKSLGDQAVLLAGSSSLEGAKLRADVFESAVRTVPFFGEKRLIIVDGLLGRFEAREKRGGWKCDSCGNPNPIHRDIATKKKLCLSCAINDCRIRVQQREQEEKSKKRESADDAET